MFQHRSVNPAGWSRPPMKHELLVTWALEVAEVEPQAAETRFCESVVWVFRQSCIGLRRRQGWCSCSASADQGTTAKLRFDDSSWSVERHVAGTIHQWLEQVPRPRLWKPSQPELHTLTLALFSEGAQVDAVQVRFGLRVVEARDSQILINGEPTLLLGVNRHESNPSGGIFMTSMQLQRDIDLLKELGANFVRGSHYSQDQRFLDLCDEHGILVWEETVAWQPTLEDFQDPNFLGQQIQALDETIDASMNHPSAARQICVPAFSELG